jgi:hypothetical protein
MPVAEHKTERLTPADLRELSHSLPSAAVFNKSPQVSRPAIRRAGIPASRPPFQAACLDTLVFKCCTVGFGFLRVAITIRFALRRGTKKMRTDLPQ